MLVRPALGSALLIAAIPVAGAQSQLLKLTASDGQSSDNFGMDVAIRDGRVAIGAWNDDVAGAGFDAGSAYLYSASSGNELQHFIASDAAAGDWFGIGVATANSRVLIGSCNDDDLGPESGSAYAYNTITGAQLYKLNASNGAAGDLYGASVALDADLGIVGAPLGDGTLLDSGAAYVLDASNGSELFKLQASDGSANDWFAVDVAISGDRALVGAYLDDSPAVDAGSAYVFDSTTGQQLLKLTAFDGGSAQNYGVSVAIDGDLALVGALNANGSVPLSGAAYLHDATTGATITKLVATDGAFGDEFGASVALSGRLALVGAPSAQSGAGALYVFDVQSGNQLYKLTPDDLAPGDTFGVTAIDGDYTVAASVRDDDNGFDSGSAYVFSTPQGPATSYCFGDNSANSCPCGNLGFFGTGCSNSSFAGARLAADGSRSVASDDLTFAADDLLPSQPALLFVGNNQVQAGNGALFGDGLRCAGGNVRRLGVQIPDAGGSATWGPALGAAGGWVAGDTRRFQCWYRDPGGFCGSSFNLSNGLEVVFLP